MKKNNHFFVVKFIVFLLILIISIILIYLYCDNKENSLVITSTDIELTNVKHIRFFTTTFPETDYLVFSEEEVINEYLNNFKKTQFIENITAFKAREIQGEYLIYLERWEQAFIEFESTTGEIVDITIDDMRETHDMFLMIVSGDTASGCFWIENDDEFVISILNTVREEYDKLPID